MGTANTQLLLGSHGPPTGLVRYGRGLRERSDVSEEFDYKSIEPEFEVWDWQVNRQDLDRHTAEFLYLEDVAPDGLTVRGSGMTNFVTASHYKPGADYELSVEEEDIELRPTTVRADESGRLDFAVHLCPSANYDEYTLDSLRSATVTIEPASSD